MKYPKLKVGYSSHGEWTTLGRIEELELERGNPFPRTPCPSKTPAIWVTKTKRKALRYLADAEEWDYINNSKNPLTPEQKKLAEEITKIRLTKKDQIIFDDGDEGYLVVRSCKVKKLSDFF